MLHGSDLQRAGRRHPKAGDVAGDENAEADSNTAAKYQVESRKQVLQPANMNKPAPLGETTRRVMNDKSNITAIVQQQQQQQQRQEKEKETVHRSPPLPPTSEHTHQQGKTDSKPVTTTKKQQQHHIPADTVQAASKAAADLNAFFKDNETRYKPKPSEVEDTATSMKPTPILPIIVPDRMKQTLREKYLSANTANTIANSKRSYEGVYQRGEQLLATLKRQKSAHIESTNRPIDKENVDPYAHATAAGTTTTTTSPTNTATTSATSAASTSVSAPASSSATATEKIITTFSTRSSPSTSVQQQPKSSFSVLQSKHYPPPNVPFDQQSYNEAKQLEQQQEKKAHDNMLRHSQTYKNSPTSDIDDESNDPMLVTEYADQIFAHLRATERDMMADPAYITRQHELTWRMRAVLIDWVIEVHYIFQLLPETLFLTVNIIDRFLSKRDVSLKKLQLVGIAALFVATKFEETTSPPIKQYLFMTGNTVTEDDLLRSERYILQILDFRLCYANPLQFFRRITMTTTFDLHLRLLAKYFMELTIIDHRFINTPPSIVAAASLWLASKMLCQGKWNNELTMASGYTVNDIKPTVELMLDYLSQPVNDDCFHKKWSSRRMMKVSIFVRDWVHRFYYP